MVDALLVDLLRGSFLIHLSIPLQYMYPFGELL